VIYEINGIFEMGKGASDTKMKDYHINVFYSDEDEGYIADIPDLRFCSAFWTTPEEALHEVQIAKSL
jgi:predicted RNase H-like HicB family nuclease